MFIDIPGLIPIEKKTRIELNEHIGIELNELGIFGYKRASWKDLY